MKEGLQDQAPSEDYEDSRRKCDSCDSKESVTWNHYQWSCKECKTKIVWTME